MNAYGFFALRSHFIQNWINCFPKLATEPKIFDAEPFLRNPDRDNRHFLLFIYSTLTWL